MAAIARLSRVHIDASQSRPRIDNPIHSGICGDATNQNRVDSIDNVRRHIEGRREIGMAGRVCQWRRNGNINLGIARKSTKHIDHVQICFPITDPYTPRRSIPFRGIKVAVFGVVCAEHDGHNVRRRVQCVWEGVLVPVGTIAVALRDRISAISAQSILEHTLARISKVANLES